MNVQSLANQIRALKAQLREKLSSLDRIEQDHGEKLLELEERIEKLERAVYGRRDE